MRSAPPAPAAQVSARPGLLRIAVVVEDLGLPLDEGAKKTCFSLIQSLGHEGAEVSVFTWIGNHSLGRAFGLPRNRLLLGPSFGLDLKRQAPDAILYIPSSSGTIGAFVRAAMIKFQSRGVPLALLSLQYRRLPESARHLGLRRFADLVFTQSEKNAEVYKSLGCQTAVLPGGVDTSVFRPISQNEKLLLRSKHGFQDSDVIVLHVGHCKPERNVTALARLSKLGLKAVLVASTSTRLDPDLLSSLEQAGVTVISTFVESIQHFYQMADCYLFPVAHAASAIDTPLSVLEAMACNLPVVTTRFGALTSLFQPGGGLYFWDSEDEMICRVQEALAEQHCRTIDKVLPYTWDRVSATILEALRATVSL